jgi:glycerol 2-dehydrogenase (NADP+)
MSMSRTTQSFLLNTGARIPCVGLGTWKSPGTEVRAAVSHALKSGYRHIDTAWNYRNEIEVGQGIKDSGVPREQIWITTKLDNPWHHKAREGFEESLRDLGCGYVDLYLIHFPCSTNPDDQSKHLDNWDFVKTWCVAS